MNRLTINRFGPELVAVSPLHAGCLEFPEPGWQPGRAGAEERLINKRTQLSWLARIRTFDSLRLYRDYRYLWAGNFCANCAQWLQLLSVGWLVRDLTASSGSSALLVVSAGGLNTVPVLFLGPWGGVLGDRINRKKLVMALQAFMACTALLFAFLVRSDYIEWWHAYVYVVVGGSCHAVTLPLRQALVANTVPRESVVNAFASNIFTVTGTRMLGPFIGGVLIATLGFFWNFAWESALYTGTVLAYWRMRTPYFHANASTVKVSLLSSLKEGITYVRKGERVIFDIIVLGLIPNAVLNPVMFLLPIFTTEVLHGGADLGGVLLSTTGLGGFIAAFTIASGGFKSKRGFVCLGAIAASSVCIILLSQARWAVLAILLVGMMSFAQGTFRTTSGSVIQYMTPDALRGRVTSLQSYAQGFLILTSLLIGWFIDLTTVVIGIMTIGAVGLGLAILSSLAFRRVRQLA
jgi:MFS family permease